MQTISQQNSNKILGDKLQLWSTGVNQYRHKSSLVWAMINRLFKGSGQGILEPVIYPEDITVKEIIFRVNKYNKNSVNRYFSNMHSG